MTTQEIIKAIRKDYSLSQKELAEKFGTTQNRVSRMENGKCSLSIDKLNEYLANANLNIKIVIK